MAERMTSRAPCGAPSRLPWGVAYRGPGEVPDAAAATARALAALGVACAVSRTAGGVVWIEGTTRRPWYRLLSGVHPQRVRGRIEAVDGDRQEGGEGGDLGDQTGGEEGSAGEREVRVALDLSFLDWYRRLVVGLWAFWVLALSALFRFTDPEQFQGGNRPPAVLLVGVFVTLAVVFWVPFLMRSIGGGRLQTMLWQPILRAIDRAGGCLEPEGSGAGRRFGFWFIGYGASFLLFGGGALVLDAIEGSREVSPGWSAFLVLLAALAGLLLGSAFALGVWRGFSLRVEAIVLGLGSSVVALFLLATPLLPAMTTNMAADIARGQPDDAGWWARLIVIATVLIVLFGIGLGLYMLSLSRYVWRPLERTYLLRGRSGIYQDAVGGGALLAAARGFFGLYALVIAGVVVVTLVLAAAWSAQALGVVDFAAASLRAPVVSGPVLAVALGLPADSPGAAVVARGAWVVWALLVWGLVGLSVGQLVRQRHRLRQCLRRRPPGEAPAHRALVERLERLVRGTGDPPVHLAVPARPRAGGQRAGDNPVGDNEAGDEEIEKRSDRIEAFSYRFAWPRRQWFIEISEGALKRLTPDELEALLAHELVHLRRGHVLALDLFRWFGRLALVGDGFCRGLLDSFGWELTADREAARLLGERKEALVRCLWLIGVVNPRVPLLSGAGGAGGAGGSGGLGMSAAAGAPARHEAGDEPIEGWAGLGVAWRHFLRQYCSGSALQYWHPSTQDRADRIQRLKDLIDDEGTAE